MKTPEIWQKFLKTYTAKVFACLIFLDLPFFLVYGNLFLESLSRLDITGYINGNISDFLGWGLFSSLYKSIILILFAILEKYYIKPDYELITSTPKGQKLEQFSIILQIIYLIIVLVSLPITLLIVFILGCS